MIKQSKILLLTALILVAGATGAYADEHVTYQTQILGKGLQGTLAREIKVGTKTAVELTADNSRIVVSPKTGPTTRYAATELQAFLSQILGKKIEIAETAGSGSNIYVGFSDEVIAKGFAPEKLARDGFYIKTIGKDIVLAGRDDPKIDMLKQMQIGGSWGYHFERASYFAVLDFLERFGGVRFYFPGELGTIVPAKKSIAVPEVDIIERPDMIKRWYLAWYDGEYFDENNRKSYPNFGKEQNLMRHRFGTMLINACHGLRGFNILERFSKTHPEYLCLMDTGVRQTNKNMINPMQLCLSSKVTDVIYHEMKAYLTGQKPPEDYFWFGGKQWSSQTFRKPYIDVGLEDGYSPCHCKDCQAAYQKDKKEYATKLVWDTYINWGERLKKDNLDAYLTVCSYPPYADLPARDVPDNLLIQVATAGPWVNNSAIRQEQKDYVANWAKKIGRPVMLWNYVNKHGSTDITGIPAYTPVSVGDYYKSIAPYIFGVFMESECDRFLYFAMNYYIFGKVTWNAQTDVKAAMNEYYDLMFGAAAPVMKKMMEDFEYIWVQKIAGKTVDTNLGPVASVPAENTLWNDIYSPEKIESVRKEFDQAVAMVKPDSLEAKRIELFRREFLIPLQTASLKYVEKTNVLKGLRFTMGKPIHLIPFAIKNAKIKETVETTVTVKCTDDQLLVHFECEEPLYDQMLFKKRSNDDPDTWRDNCVEIFLDPEGKRQSYYQIIVNAGGAVLDYQYKVIGKNTINNIAWNSEAVVKHQKTAKGYTVDVAIPLKNLGKLNENGFPVNFARDRILRDTTDHHEEYVTSPLQKGYHDIENFATLVSGKKELIHEGDFDSITTRNERSWGYYDKNGIYYGWGLGGGTKLTDRHNVKLDKEVFFTAPQSLKLSSDDNYILAEERVYAQLKPNTQYRLSCMVKLQDVVATKAGGGFRLNITDSTNAMYPRNPMTGNCDWTYLSFIHKTPMELKEAKSFFLRIWLMNAKGTAWVDNVSLEEITNE